MAENESFLDTDELNSSTVSAFIKFQAFVRGFLVRRLLDDIRQEYEDIVKDVDTDCVVDWPDRFGFPFVKKFSKSQRVKACLGQNNHNLDAKQNQTEVSVKNNYQPGPDNIGIGFENAGEKSTLRKSPFGMPSPYNEICCRNQCERNGANLMNENEGSGFDAQNENNDEMRQQSHTVMKNESSNGNIQKVSKSDQGVQIDLGSHLLMDGMTRPDLKESSTGLAEQSQMMHWVTAEGSKNLKTNCFSSEVVDNSCEKNETHIDVGNGHSAHSLQSDVETKGLSTPQSVNQENSMYEQVADDSCGIASRDYGDDKFDICEVSDEAITGSESDGDVHKEARDDSMPLKVSPISSEKSKSCNSAVVTQEELVPEKIPAVDTVSPNDGVLTCSSVQSDAVLGVEDACNGNNLKSDNETIFPDLPNDKDSLLELKKTLTMELLWIQQAINSRKHYLQLKQQLAP